MAKRNANLHTAKREQNNEFYTQLKDIENELRHYTEHFKGKVVYCNCDDPRVSNFFHYFSYNFERLGLKKLISTCYKNRNIDLFSQHNVEKAVALVYEGDKDGNKIPNKSEIELIQLEGDGDFASKECVEFLKQADIVVTNPPFSLFREYVALLEKYNKKFLIIGSQNAITYKEIFPLIAKNKIWLGNNQVKEFLQPDGTIKKFGNILWFTNLEHNKRHEKLILVKKYKGNEKDYPKYDNYNAINVDKVAEIPVDYFGVMGVPITFLDKYNPEQFEIVAFRKGDDGKDLVYSLNTGEIEEHNEERREEKRREEWCSHTSEYSSEEDVDRWTDEQSERYNDKRQKQICKNTHQATAIAGMIKNAEGKINGKITYARITIRRI